ncbi:MAG TPA: hypothetical protein PKA41_13810 [Verrucomicrobiota bacterium]|nr:hypothetical protein [Verrucomicrobiota bacterium]
MLAETSISGALVTSWNVAERLCRCHGEKSGVGVLCARRYEAWVLVSKGIGSQDNSGFKKSVAVHWPQKNAKNAKALFPFAFSVFSRGHGFTEFAKAGRVVGLPLR